MGTRRLILSLMVGLVCPAIAFGQNASDPFKPKWLHKVPYPTNSTFIYQTFKSSAYSLEDARKNTILEMFEDAGMKGGVAIVSDYNSTQKVSQVWENGRLKETISKDFVENTQSKSSDVKLHAALIDEYWKKEASGLYHVYRLYAKSELGKMPLYDNVELTTSYASDPAIWGLSLIPGAAQMHKGSYLKGGIIMGGTVALTGGLIVFQSMRSSYLAKINQTHSADIKIAYNNRAGNCATARNICIGGLAALYVYNIVDAFVAPGARRIIVTPAVTSQGQYGVGMQYTF